MPSSRRVDRRQFAKDGFAIVPGVVSPRIRETALRAINNWFVNGFDSTQLAGYRSLTYAPEIVESEAIVNLCTKSPVMALAASLVGQPLLAPGSGQIALRFPAPVGENPSPPGGGHIDGLPAPNNGVPDDGTVHAFTVLAGVLLSDVRTPGNGNFTVWPGTHHAMASWFRENGTKVRDPMDVYEANGRIAAQCGEPTAVTGRAGDVIFAHHLLVHTVGDHVGPAIRYAVFFRLRVRPWGEDDDATLTDPWHEYVGMDDMV